MTTHLVTRHPGAREWVARHGLVADRQVAHLAMADIAPGDVVVGNLPMHLAAEVCARGGRYYSLVLDLPADARGRELTADELERHGARLEAFHVQVLNDSPGTT